MRRFVEYFTRSWLVLLLAVLCGTALALVERGLQPRIQANRRARLEAAVLRVVPGGRKAARRQVGGHLLYRVTDGQGLLAGWAAPLTTTGFQDRIELLVGLSADGRRLTGLEVLASLETPGLGQRIEEAPFRDQFRALASDRPLVLARPGRPRPDGGQPIDAISGATISSEAVVRGLNQQLGRIRAAIEREGRR